MSVKRSAGIRPVKRSKSPFWIARGSVSGIRIEQSTGTTDLEQARQYCIALEADLWRRHRLAPVAKDPEPDAALTFAEAALSYTQARGPQTALIRPLEYFGTTPVDQINQMSMDRAARLLFPGRKPSTINRELFTPVLAVVNHAADCELCKPLRLKRPRIQKVDRPDATPEEAARVMSKAAPHVRCAILFMILTAARRSEVVRLTWRDVNLQAGTAYLTRTKNGDARSISLVPQLVAALANLRVHQPGLLEEQQVFSFATPSGLGHAVSRAARAAGLPHLTSHVIGRHTFAKWFRSAGGDINELMEAVGWRSINSALVYDKVSPKDAQQRILQFPQISPVDGGNLGDNASSSNKRSA